jgi:hypothetical protein
MDSINHSLITLSKYSNGDQDSTKPQKGIEKGIYEAVAPEHGGHFTVLRINPAKYRMKIKQSGKKLYSLKRAAHKLGIPERQECQEVITPLLR